MSSLVTIEYTPQLLVNKEIRRKLIVSAKFHLYRLSKYYIVVKLD